MRRLVPAYVEKPAWALVDGVVQGLYGHRRSANAGSVIVSLYRESA